MRKIHLDFESRSRVDIWTSGAYIYASDDSTEIICLAYAVDNAPVKIIRYADILMADLIDPFSELRELAEADDTLFYAHNAIFEQLIWMFKLTAYGLPRMPIRKWRCTAAKALAHGLPKSLQDCAKALGLKHQKDMAGKQAMLKICRPKNDGSWEEDPDLIKIVENYCGQDVETERDIDNSLPELHPLEQYVWFEDQLINQRGICVDIETVKKVLTLIDEETDYLTKQLFTLTNGKLEGVSRRLAVMDYFAKKGHPLPDFTKNTVETAIRSGKLPPDLTEVLRIRQQLGLTSIAKYKALLEATSKENRLCDILIYHSASTGRWGGKLVQLQNLPKGNIKDTDTAIQNIIDLDADSLRVLYGNVMGLFSSCIRGMFIASPGHDLIVSDYNAIEARVLMWFCDQVDAVRMFQDGVDIYVKMAERIGKDASRQLGKQAVLGCGYGMGPDKFRATCATYGIKIDDELAAKAIKAYRDTFKNVPMMWRKQENAMKMAISTGQPVTCGRVIWSMDARGRDFLYCTLPSGRRLAYHKPQLKDGKISYFATDSQTKKYIRKETYGGKIIENCLTGDTRVVTITGVKKLKEIQQGDKVWDGNNWVVTDGVIKRGIKPTGSLESIRLTADHKILAGNLWKPAIELDESSWQDALKKGLSLVSYGLSKVNPENRAELLASVIAEQWFLSIQDNYTEELVIAGDVAIKMQLTQEGNIKTPCLPISYIDGFIDLPEWFLDAIIRPLKRIRITVLGVSKCILRGWKIALNFWNGRKRFPIGKKMISIWNELITIGGIFQKIFALPKEKIIAKTDETQFSASIKAEKFLLLASGKSMSPTGKAETASNIISIKEKLPKKLWASTGRKEEVFDLLNCGPNNCFTIVSSKGLVIVHNCIQATARDILAGALLNAEKKGYKVVLTVHDEIVSEVEENFGSVEEFNSIITTVPKWAEGCPIKAEGWRGKRYKK